MAPSVQLQIELLPLGRRSCAAGAGSAPGLGRRRRHARVCRPRRDARAADGARDHRRHAGAVRAVRGGAPARGRAGRPRAAAGQRQLPRLYRRDARAGGRRRVPAVRADDEPDRPGTRLAPDAAPGLRRGDDPPRRQLRRQPAGRDRQDPLPARDLRPRPVPAADHRRRDAARQGDALDRAVRHRSRAGGPGTEVARRISAPAESAA